MQINQLEKAIRESFTAIDETYVKSLILPSIEIIPIESEITIGASKLGGVPDVPKDFQWPTHSSAPYRFIAQFNLKEIAQPQAVLPTAGLLSVFVADDEEKKYVWGDEGYAKVFLFPQVADLVPCHHSEFTLPPCLPIRLENSIDIPFRRELLNDPPLNEEQIDELSYDICDMVGKNLNYLLGYPYYCTLGYDPRPDEKWMSLLTLQSLVELDWCWHDGGDMLLLFIEKEKLAKGDFSNIRYTAG